MTILDLFMHHRQYSKTYKDGYVRVFYTGDYFSNRTKKMGYRGLKNLFESGVMVGFECSPYRYKLIDNKIEVMR